MVWLGLVCFLVGFVLVLSVFECFLSVFLVF